MKLPWHNKTGYAKAIAILATILTISIGLCGANWLAVIRFVPLGGPAPPPGTPTWPTTLLSITAWIEIIGILGSIVGLAIVKDFEHREKSKARRNQKGTD